MNFEYDPNKSAANLVKHGIDFEAAKALWSDPAALEVPAKVLDEPRFIVIGKIGSQHWTAVITYRAETIRIISVRRARDNEKNAYENFGL